MASAKKFLEVFEKKHDFSKCSISNSCRALLTFPHVNCGFSRCRSGKHKCFLKEMWNCAHVNTHLEDPGTNYVGKT